MNDRLKRAEYFISHNHESLGAEQQAQLYAYRMQFLKGKCDPSEKPSIFERDEAIKRRWMLWNSISNLTQKDAAEGYIRATTAAYADWENWDGFPLELQKSAAHDDITLTLTTPEQAETELKVSEKNLASSILKQTFSAATTNENPAVASAAATLLQGFIRSRLQIVAAKKTRLKLMKERETEIREQQSDFIEFWNLLLQGMTVVKYKSSEKGSATRVLWLDTTQRLRIEESKRETTTGNKGIHLRDLSAVRSGAKSFVFRTTKAPIQHDRCMSLIGTERTIDISLTSTKARDEAVRRFQVLVTSIQMTRFRLAQYNWVNEVMCSDRRVVDAFRQRLRDGIRVCKHESFEKKYFLKLWLMVGIRGLRFVLAKSKPNSENSMGVDLEDISEIRLGINSFVFETSSNSKTLEPRKCFSIIGSEGSIDLEFETHHDMLETANSLVDVIRCYLEEFAWDRKTD